MNTEDFVTYEQALELKKLGFREKCLYQYNSNSGKLESTCIKADDPGQEVWITDFEDCYNNYPNSPIIDAPTIYQVYKWLRKKDYWVELMCFSGNEWDYLITRISDGEGCWENQTQYKSYEEALSAGITECLKLLENG